MITYNGNILTTSTGKWYIPNRPYSISYSTVPNGTFSGPSQAYGGQLVTVTATGSSSTYIKDYITVNGVQIVGNTFIMPYGDVVISGAFMINPNPLNLPPYTIRVGLQFGQTTKFDTEDKISSMVLKKSAATYRGSISYNPRHSSSVPYTLYIWDITYNNSDWSRMFNGTSSGSTSGTYNGRTFIIYGANTTGVTNMSYLFNNNNVASNVPIVKLAHFDTSTVTNMEGMLLNVGFVDLEDLTNIKYDTSNVTNMSYMFKSVKIYNTPDASTITLPMLNTSKATNMALMFSDINIIRSSSGYSGLNFPLYDTSKVTNMESMFHGILYGSVTVPLFNTSSLVNMKCMFKGCKYLNAVRMFNTVNVTDCTETFDGCLYTNGANTYNLYRQLSTQTNPPTSHTGCFRNCAGNGDIPSGWR